MGEWGRKVGDVRISYQGEIVEKGQRLTLDQVLPGLPPAGYGASVPLVELCEGELKEKLLHPLSNPYNIVVLHFFRLLEHNCFWAVRTFFSVLERFLDFCILGNLIDPKKSPLGLFNPHQAHVPLGEPSLASHVSITYSNHACQH